ncbi:MULTISPECIES: hypothetical protein [unclassified Microcoleus]|uniref:hypothetical protein n=1 Tax=unclassified Microcoleus TaxID=2642155 RepID=UPI00312BCBA5
MLRDADNPEKSWEDSEAELAERPDRPFYARSDAEAALRCEQLNREATKHPDVTGKSYYTCDDKKRKNR